MSKFHKASRFLSGILIIAIVLGLAIYYSPKAQAAGITSMSISGSNITSSSANTSTVTTVTVAGTFPTAITTSVSFTITLNGISTTGTPLTGVTVTGASCTDTTVASFSAPGANPTVVTFDNIACPAATAVTFAFTGGTATTTSTAGNYTISIINTNDSGSILFYVGDENDVSVTAVVNPTLAFTIRNSADNADLSNVGGGATGPNLCSLGVLTTGSVSTCAYRLKVSTNAISYTVSITSDGDLRYDPDGAGPSPAVDIDAIAENGTVTAGTEGYGIAVVGGSATGGTITEAGNFNDDDTPIPLSPTTLITSSGPNSPSGTDTTNTTLITHRAAISPSTAVGNYSHLVTYTLTATF